MTTVTLLVSSYRPQKGREERVLKIGRFSGFPQLRQERVFSSISEPVIDFKKLKVRVAEERTEYETI